MLRQEKSKPKESAPATSHSPRLTSLRPERDEKILWAVHSWLSLLSHVALPPENIPGRTPDRGGGKKAGDQTAGSFNVSRSEIYVPIQMPIVPFENVTQNITLS